MPSKIILAAEYMTSPLFLYEEANYEKDFIFDNLNLSKSHISGPIQVEELPLSDSLEHDLLLWDKEYQNTFDTEYPPDSGFKTTEEKELHSERGKELARRIQFELGEGYLVEYKS